MTLSMLNRDHRPHRIKCKSWESSLGNVGSELGTSDDLRATGWILLDILVANKRIVFPSCQSEVS